MAIRQQQLSPEPSSRSTSAMDMSTNANPDVSISESLRQLSLNTPSITSQPPSPTYRGSDRSPRHTRPASTLSTRSSTIRKSSSIASLRHDSRSPTPSIHKKPSVSSLSGKRLSTGPRTLSRRSSSNYLSTSSQEVFGDTEEMLPVTAASIAHAYLKKDLDLHPLSESHTEAVVILQDSCYGHRFSRPRTSKANLATIVERPERLSAIVLGASAAYVMLGQRYSGGRYAPRLEHDPSPVPRSLPFRFRKTGRVVPLDSPVVTHIHGTEWMEELKMMCDQAEAKLALGGKELERPPKDVDLDAERPKFHEGDLYLCSESLNALEGALGGVCEAVDSVFRDAGQGAGRRAFVCIRPPGHHCSSDFPSGFCWINNVHVGISHAAMNHGLTHAAIIDFDLHHGDGSQTITWEHNERARSLPRNAPAYKKTPIGYFSLHDINSYPCEMGDEEKVRNASVCIENAHGQSIWNVHLQPWKTEEEFWKLYESRYMILIDKARSFLRAHTEKFASMSNHAPPKAAIFISAGFDASEWESPGMQRHKVNVPTDFYAKFTADIVRLSQEEGVGVDGRVVSVLEGGYSDRALTSGIFSHMCGLANVEVIDSKGDSVNGLGYELGQRLGVMSISESDEELRNDEPVEPSACYDSRWWAGNRMDELERMLNPVATHPPPRKPRNAHAANYQTPTQSFTAKMVRNPTPPKGRKSFASSSQVDLSRESVVRRAASPVVNTAATPPEVDWATSAVELSKLLIPTDRQTKSCRPEELNAEASRVRRQAALDGGVSDMPPPPPEGTHMQLRSRKIKPVPNDAERPGSRVTRRQTIAATELATDEKQQTTRNTRSRAAFNNRSADRSARRMSVASGSPAPIGDIDRLVHARPATSMARTRTREQPRSRPASRSTTRSRTLPKRQPTLPRVPSSNFNEGSSVSQLEDSVHVAEVSNTKEKDHQDDVDKLTVGLKKMTIKLNMPPKEVQIERERAHQEEMARAAAAAATATSKRSASKRNNTKTSSNTPQNLVADRTPSPSMTNSSSPIDTNPTEEAGPSSAISPPQATQPSPTISSFSTAQPLFLAAEPNGPPDMLLGARGSRPASHNANDVESPVQQQLQQQALAEGSILQPEPVGSDADARQSPAESVERRAESRSMQHTSHQSVDSNSDSANSHAAASSPRSSHRVKKSGKPAPLTWVPPTTTPSPTTSITTTFATAPKPVTPTTSTPPTTKIPSPSSRSRRSSTFANTPNSSPKSNRLHRRQSAQLSKSPLSPHTPGKSRLPVHSSTGPIPFAPFTGPFPVLSAVAVTAGTDFVSAADGARVETGIAEVDGKLVGRDAVDASGQENTTASASAVVSSKKEIVEKSSMVGLSGKGKVGKGVKDRIKEGGWEVL